MSHNWIPPLLITNPYKEGALLFKKILLDKVTKMEGELQDEDIEGHIWLNKFREFINEELKDTLKSESK